MVTTYTSNNQDNTIDMKQNWESYEKAAEKGPLSLALKVFFGLVIFACIAGPTLWALGFIGGAAKVAEEQLNPQAVQHKYEWFKNVSAELDAKSASIKAFENKNKALADAYQGKPRGEWPRDERQEFNQTASEIAGLKASFNNLAGEYNANMAKWNFRFANKGDLPAGASVPLPREVKPYVVE